MHTLVSTVLLNGEEIDSIPDKVKDGSTICFYYESNAMPDVLFAFTTVTFTVPPSVFSAFPFSSSAEAVPSLPIVSANSVSTSLQVLNEDAEGNSISGAEFELYQRRANIQDEGKRLVSNYIKFYKEWLMIIIFIFKRWSIIQIFFVGFIRDGQIYRMKESG